MIAEVRTYTINKNQMDSWLEHFAEVKEVFKSVGVDIVAAYVNRPQNEFIWIRTFKDEADRDAKMIAFRSAIEAAGIKLGDYVAKMEFRTVEPAFSTTTFGV
jgi:hypothetical protein